ncbi:HU family DNA-binding protein [uncultured Bacteroides sp.]|uniref:HU family DNA-binding protein n=1 Tax=uncultured Bacteroides sp. TaxID=162156 RepID=UPI00262FADEF|nr:HU family DNA-binding protein [uncultured Bacteroides sp.]
MDRAVTYSVVGRRNPRNQDAPVKFYAQAQARGEMGIRTMAERIQNACTVTRADIMAVLIALSEVVSEGLQNGEIVRLGDLGSLQVSLSSKGAETQDDFTASMISKTRVNFRPGEDLAKALGIMSFQRVETKSQPEAKPVGGAETEEVQA